MDNIALDAATLTATMQVHGTAESARIIYRGARGQFDRGGGDVCMLLQQAEIEARCRSSFARQALMTTLGARLTSLESGRAVIELPFRNDLTQQHGFLHAGAVTSIADSACGYAALTLMDPGAAVLSVEFKINLMKPAIGSAFQAIGKVIRSGRTLTVCTGEVFARHKDQETQIALMQATMMAVRGEKITD